MLSYSSDSPVYIKFQDVSGNNTLKGSLRERRKFFVGKRIFDLVVSSMVTLFVLSWLLPIIGLLIKLSSKGPVFFIQRRVGLGGRSFSCFKFRTMIMNEDANTKQATEKDARITKLGAFLRKSNLDEFPQFLNVLLGDMSIVGPRPHMHSDCNKFSSAIQGYKSRNMVRPGITGLAQIKGFRGPTKDFSSMFKRYQMDAFYLRNAGFGLDMRIIRTTFMQTINVLKGNIARFISPVPIYRRLMAALFSMLLLVIIWLY